MQSKLVSVIVFSLIVFVPSADSLGQEKREKQKPPPKQTTPKEIVPSNKPILRAPTGPGFYLERIPETPNQYSLLLTDAEKRSVAGTFITPQLALFQALLVAAKDFGQTTESAGTTAKPVTTRFTDKGEPSFAIDVEKTATHSRFYVSMTCLAGKVTVDAGTIKRGSKDQGNPLMFAILSRVNEVVGENK